jgi:translation initiation factor 1 (eIF-1/SUI1)
MLTQTVGLVIDIGLGALAYSLARALKANLAGMSALLTGVIKTQGDHEERITVLEKR